MASNLIAPHLPGTVDTVDEMALAESLGAVMEGADGWEGAGVLDSSGRGESRRERTEN